MSISLSSTNDHPSYHPLGPRLEDFTPGTPPTHTPLTGRHVILLPTSTSHAPSLYTHLCGPANDSLWTFIGPWGPFTTLDAFTTHLTSWLSTTDALFSITLPSAPQTPLGLIGLVRYRTVARDVEVGPVIYGRALQRTVAGSEAVKLVLGRAFEECRCRRVAWECNVLNVESRRAAERVGFVFEGVWRHGDVVKGRSRDTCWLSMLDGEWEGVKAGFERWVEGVDGEGRQRETLEEARRAVVGGKGDGDGLVVI